MSLLLVASFCVPETGCQPGHPTLLTFPKILLATRC